MGAAQGQAQAIWEGGRETAPSNEGRRAREVHEVRKEQERSESRRRAFDAHAMVYAERETRVLWCKCKPRRERERDAVYVCPWI